MTFERLQRAADFGLRLVFFAAAPFLVVFAAELFPVTGAVLQVALALAVFLFSEASRRVLGERPWLRRLLKNQLAFDAYYRTRAPRPFLYYVFYPVLFPYWLTNREARREFWLFKGYTWPAFVLLLASLVVQYARVCPPQLSFGDFYPIALGSLLAESVVVLMFLMPLVTSVVHFHRQKAPRRLTVLLIAAMLSTGFAIARIERRRDPIVSFATRTRVRLRSEASPSDAQNAQERALVQAWVTPADDVLPEDGRVDGARLLAARTALEAFYKSDEAYAFELWYSAQPAPLITLFFPARRQHAPIWLAMDRARLVHRDARDLSTRAVRVLGLDAK